MGTKLHVKDLISIGIFSALYIAAYVVLSGVLFTPVLFILILPIGALLLGPVYMLFVARTGKPFCIAALGFLCAAVVGLLVYGNIVIALVNLGFALVAEVLAYFGRYKNFLWLTASYSAMSLWVSGQLGAFWFARDWIRALTVNSGYSAEYADGLLALATSRLLIILVVATIVCAAVSSVIAQRMLKKHFRRAGIV